MFVCSSHFESGHILCRAVIVQWCSGVVCGFIINLEHWRFMTTHVEGMQTAIGTFGPISCYSSIA